MSGARTPVDVAAGVLIRSDGRFLLASRPSGKPYASYWEFPGGKVEAGESIAKALARELHEELSIDIGSSYPWITRVFDYPHALVRLHFLRVFEWRGELRAREQQRFGFFSADLLPDGPLLPATVPVLKLLRLPPVYAITAVARFGVDDFLRRFEFALERGLKLLLFREPLLNDDDASAMLRTLLQRAHRYGAKVLVSSRHRPLQNAADGVHLTAQDSMGIERRPDVEWVAASTHSRSEIDRAAALGVDFVVHGPVAPTSSHAERRPLGWEAFEATIQQSAMPVYALGGMRPSDLPAAMQHGAHGVASLSAVWTGNQCLDGSGASEASDIVSDWLSDPAIE